MKFLAFLPLIALAACTPEPAAQPTAAPTVAAAAPAPAQPALPAPNKDSFAAVLAKACPKAEKVNDAACKRAGFGSDQVLCKYSLGEDKYMRDEATLVPGDGGWALNDPQAECGKHMAHHAG